jgi:small subunit ribosomal protein S4e
MVKNHLQRLASPKTWKVERKKSKYITRPSPGGHPKEWSISINTVMKEILGIAKTTKEVKHLLNNKDVLVNDKPVISVRFPVGLMDILSIPKSKTNHRVILDTKGKLDFIVVSDASKRVARIDGKVVIKGGNQTLTLHNGGTLINDSKCKVGDSLLLESGKFKQILPMEDGAFVLLLGGNNVGVTGKVKRIFKDGRVRKIEVEHGSETLVTLEKFAFVLGKSKSEVDVKKNE